MIRAFRPIVRSSSTGGEPRAGSRSSVSTLIRIPPASSVARLPPFSSAAIRPSQPPAAAPGAIAEPPDVRRLRRDRLPAPAGVPSAGQTGRAGASARATAASSDGAVTVSALQRAARRPDLVADRLDEPLRLGRGPPATASSRSRRARRRSSSAVRRASAARASAARARSSASLVSPSVSRIRASVSSKARWFSDSRERASATIAAVEAEPLGDRERLAAARQPDRQAVRRRERLEVELDRGVPRAAGRVGVGLQLGVVGRRGDERAGPDEVVEERLGERRALGRVGAGAELVEQDERARPRRLDDPDDRAQMARERREALGDRLLVADVGEDVAEDRQPASRPRPGRGARPGASGASRPSVRSVTVLPPVFGPVTTSAV